MAEVAGLHVIPHDGFIGVLHAMLSQSPAICPIGEYLIKSSLQRQKCSKRDSILRTEYSSYPINLASA